MATLPFAQYAQVSGQLLITVGDTDADVDKHPDGVYPSGTVILTPKVTGMIKFPAFNQSLFPRPITLVLDGEGYLTLGGDREIYVPPTDDEQGNPVDWAWEVSFDVRTPDGLSLPVVSYLIQTPAGVDTDIFNVAPVSAGGGVLTTQGPPGPNGPSGPTALGASYPAYTVAPTMEWIPSLHAYNLKASNTSRWRRGLHRAGRQDYAASVQEYNELWLGDSIVGGCTGLSAGAGGTIRFDRLNTVADFSSREVARCTGQQVAGTGLVRWRDNTRDDERFTYSPAPNTGTSLQRATGQYAEFTSNLPGNQVRVYYYDNFSAATTGFSVSVNGASSGSGFANVVGSSSNKWKYVTLDTAITAGQKVRVTSVAATVQFSFVEVKDTAKKVNSHNLAASGSRVFGDWETVSTGFAKIRQFRDDTALPFVPDVIHLVFGFFDAPDNDAAKFKTSLLTMLTNLSTIPADIVLHAGPLPGQYRGVPAGGQSSQIWWDILNALYQVATERDLPLVDVQHATGGYPVLNPLGLAADNTAHYLQPVYADWGRRTAKVGLS